jgi:hypothetical protein
MRKYLVAIAAVLVMVTSMLVPPIRKLLSPPAPLKMTVIARGSLESSKHWTVGRCWPLASRGQ